MKLQYINLNNQKDLIEGVVLKKLTIHKDASGILVETLRNDWTDVLGKTAPFAMQYMSVTPSGQVRDEDVWHVHKKQKDRFICVSGRIITALYDPRRNSQTRGKLNLLLQGPDTEEEMFMALIPEDVYHAFIVISKEPGYLLNAPTQLYTKGDEQRVENTQLKWQDIRDDFNI